MMSSLREEELEFIAVSNDDENEMNSGNYVDPHSHGRSDSAIGNWFLNQSKVEPLPLCWPVCTLWLLAVALQRHCFLPVAHVLS